MWWRSIACVAIAVGTAAADPNPEAEKLFRDGRKLLADGKPVEACDAFGASAKLEPSVGTLLNLGDCRAKLNQTASAWAAFVAAGRLARKLADPRMAEADRRSAELEPTLSYLTINVTPVPQLAIERDNVATDPTVWGQSVPVDPGRIAITAHAPGYDSWSTTVDIAPNGERRIVTVPALHAQPVAVHTQFVLERSVLTKTRASSRSASPAPACSRSWPGDPRARCQFARERRADDVPARRGLSRSRRDSGEQDGGDARHDRDRGRRRRARGGRRRRRAVVRRQATRQRRAAGTRRARGNARFGVAVVRGELLMRARWLVVAIAAIAALAACNRLFGISEIPYAGDAHAFNDAPPDAAPMAILEIGDPALDVGQVTRGESSFAATVGITNVGDATTGVLGMMGTGDQTDYEIDLGTCNTTLAPGAGCKLKITFMPQAVGTFNETAVIGDGVAMTTIMLTGVGLTPGALSMLSPIGFGSAAVSSTNTKQSITAMNTGSATVTINTISVMGTNDTSFAVMATGTCEPGVPVNGGQSCTIDVDFEPQLGGTQLASLTVTTASSSNPSVASLGGTGTTTVSVAKTGTGTGAVDSSDNAIKCGSLCSAMFDTSTVTLTGVVQAQTAIGWSPNCVMQSSTSCAITVNQPSFDVTATFTAFPVLTVAVSGSPGEVTGGGIDCESSSGPTCSMAFQPGSSVTLVAAGQTGSVFDDWTGACSFSSLPR